MSDKIKVQTFNHAGTNIHVVNDIVPMIDIFGDKAEANGNTVAKFIKKHCSTSFIIGMMKFFSKNSNLCRICHENKGHHIADGLVICKNCEELYF
jgi:hypothetical protein